MSRTIETGVFIPIGNHGWIHSTNAPPAETGTYARLLEVVQGAEALGFDFVLSPSIWRGRKGPSKHWTSALESVTATAGLLQATSRIKIFSTVHMTVFPPATIAKKIQTLDQIAPGRVGLNLVTGSSYLDLASVGLWNDDLDHDERYDMADEWIEVVKKFWTEDVVTHKGKFFETADALMGPTVSKMPSLVNAGSSVRGFRFAAQNCNFALMGANDSPEGIAVALRCRETANELGKPDFKTYALAHLIPGETDEDAQAQMDHYDAGVDLECLADIAAGYAQNRSQAQLAADHASLAGGEKKSATPPGSFVGSYETLARRLANLVKEADLDGLMITVPDFVVDLDAVAKKTLPLMAEFGVNTVFTRG